MAASKRDQHDGKDEPKKGEAQEGEIQGRSGPEVGPERRRVEEYPEPEVPEHNYQDTVAEGDREDKGKDKDKSKT